MRKYKPTHPFELIDLQLMVDYGNYLVINRLPIDREELDSLKDYIFGANKILIKALNHHDGKGFK